MKKIFAFLILFSVFTSTAYSEALRVIPYPEGTDTQSEGASSAPKDINHKPSAYFNTSTDFFTLKSKGTLTILNHYPTYQQTKENTCGPAAALTVLYYFGVHDYDEASLSREMKTQPYPIGTNPKDMLAFFVRLGWKTDSNLTHSRFDEYDNFKEFVLKNLREGTPIMVENVYWGGHWRVIIGYDDIGTESTLDDVLILADPYDTCDHNQDGYGVENGEMFYATWFDHSMLPEDQRDQPFIIARPKTKGETANVLKWWQKKPVYQVYPKSFLDTDGTGTGDIKGITQKLDYIKSLDAGAIWITPVYSSPMVDNGYDISDYTDINPLFGSMNDFDELVREADKRGIKIVMDLVFNHTSDHHKWFLESKQSRDNAKADWYIWRDAKPDGSEPTNWRAIFGGSAWTWNEERKQYYLHTFAKEQPDLNWENPDVRHALYDAAKFWLSKGVGGFRIDAITYIKKPKEFIDGTPDNKDGTVNIHLMTANTPGILDFLREFKREVREGRDIFTVGEANGVSPEELSDWVGTNGVFDMLFEFSHVTLPFGASEIWCYPREWKLTDLKHALTASQNATSNNGWYPIFFENHDQPRSVNHFFPEGYDAKKAAKVLATVLMTLRGTPFIYQGEELGMTNRFWRDIDEINDVQTKGQYEIALHEGFSKDDAMKFIRYFSRDNARTPMQWNSSANAGFTPEGVRTWLPLNDNYTAINAESEEEDSDSVLNWYRKLLAFRKNNDVLLIGTYREILSDSEEVFAFVREHEGREVITLANFSDKPVKIPEELVKRKVVLSSERDINPSELAPLEARIYMRD